ncbi:hypothetical protein BDN71DRAFT_415880 [Pleurotus eryngii]|uniref:Uncharacterized protein n=1 Tax=Pleurotus eryngii TaxID=5323 RepID=A0A9P6A5R5_PLEER|nr:hypothetical protein BDN71DRAFT_415880 [Pleurotus eryngii]
MVPEQPACNVAWTPQTLAFSNAPLGSAPRIFACLVLCRYYVVLWVPSPPRDPHKGPPAARLACEILATMLTRAGGGLKSSLMTASHCLCYGTQPVESSPFVTLLIFALSTTLSARRNAIHRCFHPGIGYFIHRYTFGQCMYVVSLLKKIL